MLICYAHNVTVGGLSRADGTSDYEVQVSINERPIYQGSIRNHVREEGASVLLRHIADAMDAHPRSENAKSRANKSVRRGNKNRSSAAATRALAKRIRTTQN